MAFRSVKEKNGRLSRSIPPARRGTRRLMELLRFAPCPGKERERPSTTPFVRTGGQQHNEVFRIFTRRLDWRVLPQVRGVREGEISID